jgi:hypothetical protein
MPMSGFASGCLWHDRQVHRSGAPGLRDAVFGTQKAATGYGHRVPPAASLATRVPVERAQGVARAWIDGFLWRRRGGVAAILRSREQQV